MTALRVGVQFHRHVGRFQSHVIAQRVFDTVHMIVLILQKECRRRLGGDVTLDIGV